MIPFSALLLCLPLLYTCLTGGDTPFQEKSPGETAFAFIALLPAFGIWAAFNTKKIQYALFFLLFLIFVWEMVAGIKPTSQLNHEGSDLAFLFLHAVHFGVGISTVLAVYLVTLVKGGFGKKDNV
ncbi:MAG TPA: hypothetical protein VFW42_08515 [Fluviicoccus sp.]|nr:hypothetical protein [Fluviicoccus sp.]